MHLYMMTLIKHDQTEYNFKLRMDRHYENLGRTNHVGVYGEWVQFGQECDFKYNQMLRFRFMYVVTDLNGPRPRHYPLFHVCWKEKRKTGYAFRFNRHVGINHIFWSTVWTLWTLWCEVVFWVRSISIMYLKILCNDLGSNYVLFNMWIMMVFHFHKNYMM